MRIALALAIALFAFESRAQELVWESGFENGFAEFHGFQHRDSAGNFNQQSTPPTDSPDWGSYYYVDCDPEVGAPEGECVYHGEVFRAATDPGISGQGHRAYRVWHADEQGPGEIRGTWCEGHWVWIDLGDQSIWPTWNEDREVWWWSPSTFVTNKNTWPNSAGIIWTVGKDGRLGAGSSQHNAQCTGAPFPQRRWSYMLECHAWDSAPTKSAVWMDGDLWCTAEDNFTGPLAAMHHGVYGHHNIPALTQYEDAHRLWQLTSWPTDLSSPPNLGTTPTPPAPIPGDVDPPPPGDTSPGDSGGGGDPVVEPPDPEPWQWPTKTQGLIGLAIALLLAIAGVLAVWRKGPPE